MLLSTLALKEYRIEAQDGDIGSADTFYYEDRQWLIRYIVCDATRVFKRYALIPPLALSRTDDCNKVLCVDASMETIKNSPHVNVARPISRDHQHILDRYYSWHITTPNELSEPFFEVPFVDTSVHSGQETLGCRLKAREGELATVDDFIIDDDSWSLRYLVLQAGLWLPGKKFLLDPRWIDEISWSEKRLFAEVSAEKIRSSPEYETGTVISPEYERSVQEHFGQPKYSTKKALEEIIRRKAQELYNKRGAVPGNDWADWFEAERLVKEELNRMIQEKARELFVRRGGRGDNEIRDWFEAERIVKEEMKRKK
jgi:hypothetical protein